VEEIYGRNHSINDNSNTQITYHARSHNTAKHISDLFGQMTVCETRESTSRKPGGLFVESVTSSEHEFGQPLMRPDDILRLPFDDVLLSIGGMHGYRGKKIMHYLDERFRDCARIPAPESVEAQRAELPPKPEHGWTDDPIEPAMDVLEELKKRFGLATEEDESEDKPATKGKGKRKGGKPKSKGKRVVISGYDAVEEASAAGAETPF
jgi:type IV secretory pathway TraG/TraD family ATPase VirD4